MPSRISNNTEEKTVTVTHLGNFEPFPEYNSGNPSSSTSAPQMAVNSNSSSRDIQNSNESENAPPQAPNNIDPNPSDFEGRQGQNAGSARGRGRERERGPPPPMVFGVYHDHFDGTLRDEIIQDVVNALDHALLARPVLNNGQVREGPQRFQLDVYAYDTVITRRANGIVNGGTLPREGPNNLPPQNNSG